MADTTTSAGNINTRHLRDLIMEWTRNNRFSKYTGTSMNNVVFQKTEAVTGRQKISMPLVTRLAGAGQTGSSSTLVGNEEVIGNYNWDLTPTYRRHAVVIDKEEADKPNFDLIGAGRPLLSQWAKDTHRDLVTAAFGSVYDGTTNALYGAASEAVKDAYLVNNADRVLFGAAKANNAANDHSAALLQIDNTADKLTVAVGSLAARMAGDAVTHIKPLRVTDDEEWSIMFCNSLSFRDLQQDPVIQQSTREAWSRGSSNPLFTGGDLIHDGVIYRKVPEIGVIAGAGAGGIDVGANYLCGQQAIGWAIGMAPKFTRKKEDDYEFETGVGIMFKDDIGKIYLNNKQHGMVTVYAAAVADA